MYGLIFNVNSWNAINILMQGGENDTGGAGRTCYSLLLSKYWHMLIE